MISARARSPKPLAVLSASLDQALHRCLVLASPFGTIRLLRANEPDVREFFLELDESGPQRLRWTLRKSDAGTALFITRPPAVARLAGLARRGSRVYAELDHVLTLLTHAVNMKIVVIGGGTGLYTTLLGLRDRTWSLTAVISGLPRGVRAKQPKDQIGMLPRDDAGLSLVALAPTVQDNVVLRGLLAHRMEQRQWRGAHFGTAMLQSLEETQGSRQAALDAAGQLLGIRGRIAIALESTTEAEGFSAAVSEIARADMVVIAPGHLELDILPVLCCPGIRGALQRSTALKVLVTKIMTAEEARDEATTSAQVRALTLLTGRTFDVVVANSGSFSNRQLDRYAAAGARPITPDIAATQAQARLLVVEPLAAAGDLARHDPERLGECLLEVGAQSLTRPVERAS
ncbi:MAG TPA: 2-phospho-L-lactate transferase CofD family protein [Candidatus Dormibacteraeota bacterium]|nr:2-phospho-L-lactate transferase CofD family protein [Candidatus Dormibacteraeota bacterium]